MKKVFDIIAFYAVATIIFAIIFLFMWFVVTLGYAFIHWEFYLLEFPKPEELREDLLYGFIVATLVTIVHVFPPKD